MNRKTRKDVIRIADEINKNLSEEIWKADKVSTDLDLNVLSGLTKDIQYSASTTFDITSAMNKLFENSPTVDDRATLEEVNEYNDQHCVNKFYFFGILGELHSFSLPFWKFWKTHWKTKLKMILNKNE